MNQCIFCKLINHEIPTKVVYQDEDIFVFNDLKPHAEIHLLIIPKQHIASMLELEPADAALMGKLMLKANQLAKEHGLNAGYKIQINTGHAGGQEVFHLHIHLIGNRSK